MMCTKKNYVIHGSTRVEITFVQEGHQVHKTAAEQIKTKRVQKGRNLFDVE